MILQLLGIPLLVIALLHLPFWLIAKKRNKITKFDFAYPFLPMVLYFSLLVTNVYNPSLANYAIEVPVIILTTLVGYVISIFFSFKSNKTLVYILAIMLLFVIIFVLSMPAIPE
jgi:hypothetical protein